MTGYGNIEGSPKRYDLSNLSSEERYNVAVLLEEPHLTQHQSAVVETLEKVIDPEKQRISLEIVASRYATEIHLSIEPHEVLTMEETDQEVTDEQAEEVLLSALLETFQQIEQHFDSISETIDSTLENIREVRNG